MLNEIEKNAHNALTEYLKDRIVAINHGTGYLLTVNEKNYILICRHIAEDFFDSNFKYVVLRKNVRIPKSELKLIAKTDIDLDIALIEIVVKRNFHCVFTMNNFDFLDDFSKYDFSKTLVNICGIPSDLNLYGENTIYHAFMSFLTFPHRRRKQEKDFIYCEYPIQTKVKDSTTDKDVTLPKAPGLSGSLILKLNPIYNNEKLWTPDSSKIIAIQNSWDQKTYIKGTNIKYLNDLLINI